MTWTVSSGVGVGVSERTSWGGVGMGCRGSKPRSSSGKDDSVDAADGPGSGKGVGHGRKKPLSENMRARAATIDAAVGKSAEQVSGATVIAAVQQRKHANSKPSSHDHVGLIE